MDRDLDAIVLINFLMFDAVSGPNAFVAEDATGRISKTPFLGFWSTVVYTVWSTSIKRSNQPIKSADPFRTH